MQHSKLSHSLSSPASNSQNRSHSSSSTISRSRSPSTRGDEDSTDRSRSPSITRPALAPDQPLTTCGKPRKRVYLACERCRIRKIRCDGTKPACNNCTRRKRQTGGPCTYDEAPRRRGKDRIAGSRKLDSLASRKTRTTRSRLEEEAKLRKKAKKAEASSSSAAEPPADAPNTLTEADRLFTEGALASSDSGLGWAGNTTADFIDSLLLQSTDLVPVANLTGNNVTQNWEHPDRNSDRLPSIPPIPSVQFVRETWWDSLLGLYASSPDIPSSLPVRTMTADTRNNMLERVKADLHVLFRVSLLWFSFIDVPRFMAVLFNPTTRRTIQPSFVLAALALATVHQSSDLELGATGMNRALLLADQAYTAFHASLHSGWIDVGLAQAAYFLTAFELQAHPEAWRPQRTQEAMHMLDSLIRYLALTTLDVDNPRTTIFLPNAVPSVCSDAQFAPVAPVAPPNRLELAMLPFADANEAAHSPAPEDPPSAATDGCCGCAAYSLGRQSPFVRQLAPQFALMPMWPKDAGAVRKEECRRLVWASVVLVTSYGGTKVTAMAGEGWDLEPLWIQDPANYALLFPGEYLADEGVVGMAASKDSVWALYMRALLLWHSCVRTQRDAGVREGALVGMERARYAMDAWTELDAIEAALDRHTCMTETGFSVKAREVLFNTRMCVSGELQRYVPMSTGTNGWLAYRQKAEQWMTYQLHVANYFTQCLATPRTTVTNHARRNFLVAWFLAQVVRGLALWEADRTMRVALDVARAFAPCAEYYLRLWPAPCQLREYERLYAPLVAACTEAGVEPPARVAPLANLALGGL